MARLLVTAKTTFSLRRTKSNDYRVAITPWLRSCGLHDPTTFRTIGAPVDLTQES
jgi:hypothetical protein